MCVLTCPTGIDIRQGLQMECIQCAQCADACDAVMRKVGKPIGLVRYGTADRFAQRPSPWLRPRVIVYPAAALIAITLLGWQLATRTPSDVALLRATGAPFTLEPDGSVMNQLRIRITNRTRSERHYTIRLDGAAPARLIAPIAPVAVPPNASRSAMAVVLSPAGTIAGGAREVTFEVASGADDAERLVWRLMGPAAGGQAR